MLHLLDWLEERSRWAELTTLGNSGLVKSSVLMPVFGYMLLLNDKVHQYLTISFDGALLNYLPSTWRIWLVFYGSFAVAVGSVIYNWRCPGEIKRFDNPMDYVAADTGYHFPPDKFKLVRDVVKDLHAGLPDWQKQQPQIKSFKVVTGIPGGETEARDILTNSLSHFWEMMNLTLWGWRVIIYLLFRVGLALLIIPAALTFLQVTLLAVKRVF